MKTSWRTGGWRERICARLVDCSLFLQESFLLHESGPEHAFGLESIVRSAAQPKVVHGRGTAASHGQHVVVLQELALLATVAVSAHVRAAVIIALSDGAF